MKKLSFLFALALLTLAACKKSEGPQQSATYRVNGITDLRMNEVGAANLLLSFEYKGIVQERVTLSLTGLPENVTVEFSNEGGTVPFSSEILVIADNATPGSYPLKLVCNGSSTGATSYDVMLTIEPVPCTQKLTGSYIGTGSCAGSSFNTNVGQIDETRIYIYNLGGSFMNVYADVNCNTNSLTIPPQNISGTVVSGSGSFTISGSSATMALQYVIDGPFPVSCTTFITK